MVDTAYFVKLILPRAFTGSFKHFVDIYVSKSVCISVCGGYQVSPTYLLTAKFHFFNFQHLPWTLANVNA